MSLLVTGENACYDNLFIHQKEADGKFVEDRKFINNVLKNFCHQIVFTSFALLSHFLKWWGEFSTNGLWRLSLSFKLG